MDSISGHWKGVSGCYKQSAFSKIFLRMLKMPLADAQPNLYEAFFWFAVWLLHLAASSLLKIQEKALSGNICGCLSLKSSIFCCDHSLDNWKADKIL